MTPRDYAVIFEALIMLWPLFFVEQSPLFWLFIPLNALLFAFVFYQTKTSALNLHVGLKVISAGYMSGLANLTILYLPFVLTFAYLYALVNSVAAIMLGKSHAQSTWSALVHKI